MKTFDRRFGSGTHLALPREPGIYRFYDEKDRLIYVGKAKNLRRRLSQYRNARRCKAHAKMRKILGEARRLEHEVCESELRALQLENQWIQKHRPKWNVAGAFSFLYPMIGTRFEDGQLHLCYTTAPETHPKFRFHGAFRSRERTKEGFFALVELLRSVGHPVPRPELVRREVMPAGKVRGFVFGFRQLPQGWLQEFEAFLEGRSFRAIEELSLMLLDRPGPVQRSAETQERLHEIRRFWKHEILTLRKAREHSKWTEYPVAQKDRDAIFISWRSGRA